MSIKPNKLNMTWQASQSCNGRTGHIVNALYLIEQGWRTRILYEPHGAQKRSLWTCEKIAAIQQLMEHTSEQAPTRLPKIYSHELIQLIFEHPYCRINDRVTRNIAKRQTASVYLKQLCEIEVLRELSAGKEKVFVHDKLMGLMTY